jgi:hypothetical protein
VNGVYDFWIYDNDKPFKEGSETLPRSEMEIIDKWTTEGIHTFEADFYVPSGTSGVSIM